MAERLSFDRAAPRRLRNDDLPVEIQEELRDLWNGIAADIYDEVAGLRRRKAFRRDNVEQALRRVAGRLLQAERVVIVTAVHFPVPGEREWRHVAVAGAGGAVAAVAEEAAAIGSLGTATTVAIVAAVVGEVFESYVAASVRTRQYIAAGRSPDPAVIVTDLAEAAGYGESAGRRASARVAHDAASWLGEKLVTRTAVRFSRSLIPVVGVGAGRRHLGLRRAAGDPTAAAPGVGERGRAPGRGRRRRPAARRLRRGPRRVPAPDRRRRADGTHGRLRADAVGTRRRRSPRATVDGRCRSPRAAG